MIGNDCRCPGCGTCDAASEVERLRERLAVERTPNGAGKWNAERVLREKAERERDELKARLAHAEADAEQAIHNEAFMERQRIVAWIRAKHALGSMDCSLSLMALDALRVVADEIERGEHER
jgi:hypothetical protein